MKKCLKCRIDKEVNEFGIDAQKLDGLNAYCKICIRKRSAEQREKNPRYTKEYAQKYRRENKEELREKSRITYYINWDKRREQSKESYLKHKTEILRKRALKSRSREEKEKNRLRQATWRNQNKSRVAEIVDGWKKRNPQKAAAHSLVLYAIRAGILIKKDYCEECGKECKTQGHHEDYFKPLVVKWLCINCHSRKHQIYR